MAKLVRVCAFLAVVGLGALAGLHGRASDASDLLVSLSIAEGASPESVRDALAGAGAGGYRLAFDLVADPDPRRRAGAAAYLGLRRSRQAVPHLIRLLRDGEAAVRRAAASALGAIGDPRALPFLERALADPQLGVAEAALLSAWQIRQAPSTD